MGNRRSVVSERVELDIRGVRRRNDEQLQSGDPGPRRANDDQPGVHPVQADIQRGNEREFLLPRIRELLGRKQHEKLRLGAEPDAVLDGKPERRREDRGKAGGSNSTTSYDHATYIQDKKATGPAYLAPVYTIRYYANNGTTATATQSKTWGYSVNLYSCGWTKAGHTFVRWNTAADGSGTAYASGATYTQDEDVTLYAQWTDPKADRKSTRLN